MHYYEEKSYKEISEELGISYEKVRKRGLRGKKKLLVLLLLALLIFGITACTTIVLKKEGLLPIWFPFYEWIPGEAPNDLPEDAENDTDIITIPANHLIPPDAQTDDSAINEVPVITPAAKYDEENYYFSPERGILDTDKPAYRIRKNTQQFEHNGIRQELLDSFYYDGQLDIYLLATVTDTERWPLPPAPDYYSVEETREYLEKYLNLLDDQIFLWDEEEANHYAGYSYIITPQGIQIPNFRHSGECYDYDLNKHLYEVSFSWHPHTENTSSLAFTYVLSDTMQFEIVLDQVPAKTFQKPSVENTSTNKDVENNTSTNTDNKTDVSSETDVSVSTNYFKLEPGINATSDGLTIIQLYQKNIGEYEIADWMTQYPLNFRNTSNNGPVLTDAAGNDYRYMRISSQPEADTSGNHKKFEIYFRNNIPGEYTLSLPALCLKTSGVSNTVTIPLPTGEESYLDCDISLLFPDGNGMHITGIERSEYTDIYYTCDEYGVTAREAHEWRYRPVFEIISSSDTLSFYGADATVTASNNAFSAGGIDMWDTATRESCYFFKVESDDMPESIDVQFSNPVFLYNQELSFDVTIQE